MSITRVDAIDALLTTFQTAWTGAGKSAANVKYDNTGQISKPPAGLTEYAIVRYRQISSDLDGIVTPGLAGGRPYTTIGLVTIEIYEPGADNGLDGDGTGEAVQKAFRGFSSNLNVRVRNVSLLEVGRNGTYMQRNVTFDFEYDTVE